MSCVAVLKAYFARVFFTVYAWLCWWSSTDCNVTPAALLFLTCGTKKDPKTYDFVFRISNENKIAL
jgi:hypothetical protein